MQIENEYFNIKQKIEIEKTKNSPLYISCMKGDYKECVRLIKSGEDVNKRGENNNTPLIVSCEFRRNQIAKLLIQNGANVHIVNNCGGNALHKASFTGLISILPLLFEKGIDINTQDKQHGNTPLHKACEYNQKDSAKYLISIGADSSIRNHVVITLIFMI